MLKDGQVVSLRVSRLCPSLMNERLIISEIFLKGPENPIQKHCNYIFIKIFKRNGSFVFFPSDI